MWPHLHHSTNYRLSICLELDITNIAANFMLQLNPIRRGMDVTDNWEWDTHLFPHNFPHTYWSPFTLIEWPFLATDIRHRKHLVKRTRCLWIFIKTLAHNRTYILSLFLKVHPNSVNAAWIWRHHLQTTAESRLKADSKAQSLTRYLSQLQLLLNGLDIHKA